MSDDAPSGSRRVPTIEVHEREVDGVRVLHFPAESGRSEASLIFGVGARDETLPVLGTLHALEHAVMAGVRRTPIDINGSVGVNTTQFTAAEGSPLHVGAFLTGVCRGLSDPPLGRLAQEAKVLEAEAEGDGDGTSPAAVIRYGFQGLGVVGGPGPGPSGARGEAVLAAASRWFVAANALLVIEGSWPADLRLPLPTGPRPLHSAVAPRQITRPSAVVVDAPVCELNLVLPAEPATLTRLSIIVLEERLTEVLRHDLGLVYTLDVDPVPIPGGYDLTIGADPTPDRVGDCVRAMVEATRRLLNDGPTDSEVEHAAAIMRESLQGRDAQIETVVDSAIDELLGFQGSPVDADAATYGREQVADHLRGVASDLIYVVDEKLEVDLTSLGLELVEPGSTTTGALPSGENFRPPLMALALAKEARASRVVLTSTGLAHAYESVLQQVAWTDVVGVMRDKGGDLVVFGREGQAISVGPSLYKKGHRLVDVALAQVPAHLVYDAPPDLDSSGSTDR